MTPTPQQRARLTPAEVAMVEAAEKAEKARPLDEYHEDMGAVLWWFFPMGEPPYCGSPLDSDWPGYHTHFTALPALPQTPISERSRLFNDTTGALAGGNRHPHRCVCQTQETGAYADTPHKHYDEAPYDCARCQCEAYRPAIAEEDAANPTAVLALCATIAELREALSEVAAAMELPEVVEESTDCPGCGVSVDWRDDYEPDLGDRVACDTCVRSRFDNAQDIARRALAPRAGEGE